MEEKEKRMSGKTKGIILALILLLIIAIAASVYFYVSSQNQPTAVITTTDNELNNVDENNKLRVIMNPAIEVTEGTMQNINFENVNKNRLLKCVISVDGEDIYESDYVKEGEVMKADLIDADKLENGNTPALAQIYSYNAETGERIGQVNVQINLIK